MKQFIPIVDMDREVAILLFNNKIYEDEINHQYIIADIFESREIDLENINLCKSIERDNGMCAIDLFMGRDVNCLIIQSIESLECANINLLRDLYNKYTGCLIGVEYSANSRVVTCYDSFEEFEVSVKEILKQIKNGHFVLVDADNDKVTILDVSDGTVDIVTKTESLEYIKLGIKIWGIEYNNEKEVQYFPVKNMYREG